MDSTTIIRVIAGVLAVAVLAFVIYRRKHAKV
jgi:LPXTG-motif cell wall-anchored protein